ncbi:MAG: hypothetical protein ACREYE_24240 [Gammaproteobacteria bacterium]
MTRYCGRDFTTEDIEQIRTLICEDPVRTRADLSRLACQTLGWHQPNGGVEGHGLPGSPAPHAGGRPHPAAPARGPKPHCKIALTAHTEAQPPLTQPVHALPKPQWQLVSRTDSRL